MTQWRPALKIFDAGEGTQFGILEKHPNLKRII